MLSELEKTEGEIEKTEERLSEIEDEIQDLNTESCLLEIELENLKERKKELESSDSEEERIIISPGQIPLFC